MKYEEIFGIKESCEIMKACNLNLIDYMDEILGVMLYEKCYGREINPLYNVIIQSTSRDSMASAQEVGYYLQAKFKPVIEKLLPTFTKEMDVFNISTEYNTLSNRSNENSSNREDSENNDIYSFSESDEKVPTESNETKSQTESSTSENIAQTTKSKKSVYNPIKVMKEYREYIKQNVASTIIELFASDIVLAIY